MNALREQMIRELCYHFTLQWTVGEIKVAKWQAGAELLELLLIFRPHRLVSLENTAPSES